SITSAAASRSTRMPPNEMQGHRHDCWRRPDNVATGVAVLAGVGDVQLAPTQAGEQSLTSAQGTAAHRVLAFGVVRNQAEVPLIVRPAQITLMMIRDQYLPILALLLEATNHLLAAGLNADAAAGAAECIRAGIYWVGQNVQDRVVDRQLPLDQAVFGAIGDGGCAFRRSRPPIPTDRDHLFRSIATMWRGC